MIKDKKLVKKILFSVFYVLLVLFSINFSFADITLSKSVENQDNLRIGDNVTIILKFNNPYNESVKIKIKDPNVFAGTGVDIQCLEHIVPVGDTGIAYDRIIPYQIGSFSLDGATITYNDPVTGEEKSNKSNGVSFEIKDNPDLDTNSIVRHGISEIYRCDGISMQSSSSSSQTINSLNQQQAENMQQQKEAEAQQAEQQAEQHGLTEEQQKELQERMQQSQMQQKQDQMQNNQMNQDASGLKQQASEELQKQNQQRQQFADDLSKNEEFMKEHQEMLDKGYELKNAEVDPKGNQSGDFNFQYENKEGDKAGIKGSMENGDMTEMTSFDKEYENQIINELRQNEEFQDKAEKIEKNGFNETYPTFSHDSMNSSKIEMKYNNSKGEEIKIEADYNNGTIENITVEKIKKNDNENTSGVFDIFRNLILLILLIIALILLYRYYEKQNKNEEVTDLNSVAIKKIIDFKKEALLMIEQAEELYLKKQEKDAYEKISYAIRFYFSYKLGIKKDLTSEELIKKLRSNNYSNINDVKKALDLCKMVEFAKYKTTKSSFDKLVNYSKKIIL